MFMIRNKDTGKAIPLVAEPSHKHPSWVHAQCGTASESELRAVMDGLRVDDYVRAGPRNEDVRGVFVSIPSGALAWKLVDPFQSARWLFDESEVVEAAELDPSLVVRVGGITTE